MADLWDGRDLNTLVMNYLIIEGYKSAAVNFAQEGNMSYQVDLDFIQERVDIRHAIHHGDIQTAIERVNELPPEVGGIFPFNFKFLGSCFVYIYCDDYFQDSALRLSASDENYSQNFTLQHEHIWLSLPSVLLFAHLWFSRLTNISN